MKPWLRLGALLAGCLALTTLPACASRPGANASLSSRSLTEALASYRPDAIWLLSLLPPTTEIVEGQGAALAWTHAAILRSLMDLYESTGDPAYARAFFERASRILAIMDDRVGRVDKLRGTAMPGWGTAAYAGSEYTVWVVHSSLVVTQLARFIEALRSGDPALSPFAESTGAWLLRLVEVMDSFDAEWVDRGSTGYYRAQKGLGYYGPWKALAFNMQCAAGSALLALGRAGAPASAAYRERAEKIARLLHGTISKTGSGTIVWRYFPLVGFKVEDTSHGAIDAVFMRDCAEAGIVFKSKDMDDLATTLESKLMLAGEGFADTLDGKGKRDPFTLARWSWLAAGRPGLAAAVDARLAVLEAAPSISPRNRLAVAAARSVLRQGSPSR